MCKNFPLSLFEFSGNMKNIYLIIIHGKNFLFSLYYLRNALYTLLLNYFINFLLDQKVTKTQGCILWRPKTAASAEQNKYRLIIRFDHPVCIAATVFCSSPTLADWVPALETKAVLAMRRLGC